MRREHVNWHNLRKNKCPKCNADFIKNARTTDDGIHCFCGFRISMERYKEITIDMNRKALQEYSHENDMYDERLEKHVQEEDDTPDIW